MTSYVLVYNGPGASEACVEEVVKSLSSFLSHKYDVKLVGPDVIANEPWEEYTQCVVFPGGRDLPYCSKLNGHCNRRIREFVEKGGSYLGFCAGAYYGSSRVEFEVGTPNEVIGDRELQLFCGVAKGSAYPGYRYSSEEYARAARVDSMEFGSLYVYFNGGCFFEGAKSAPNTEVLAEYADLQETAIVKCSVGHGKAILSGVHVEFNPKDMDVTDQYLKAIIPYISQTNPKRMGLLHSLLKQLGLDVKEPGEIENENTDLSPLILSSCSSELMDEFTSMISKLCDEETTFIRSPGFHFVENESSVLKPTSESYVPVYVKNGPKKVYGSFDKDVYFSKLEGDMGRVLLYGNAVSSTQTLLEKYGFWIFCGALLFFSVVIWWCRV